MPTNPTNEYWTKLEQDRDKLVAALQVITLTPAIRAFLEATDPKALQQAEAAIAEAKR